VLSVWIKYFSRFPPVASSEPRKKYDPTTVTLGLLDSLISAYVLLAELPFAEKRTPTMFVVYALSAVVLPAITMPSWVLVSIDPPIKVLSNDRALIFTPTSEVK